MVLFQLKRGGVAKAKGEGEKEKECTTECKGCSSSEHGDEINFRTLPYPFFVLAVAIN